MKNFLTLCMKVFVVTVVLATVSCRNRGDKKKYSIGFSQCVGGDSWRQTMLAEMKRELSFHTNINFIYKDANGSSELQIKQIDSLLQSKIDLLLVSPNEIDSVTPAIEKAYRVHVPVVEIDRRTKSAKPVAFIGASNFEVGQNAGRYAAALLKGTGNAIEITGLPENASYIIERHNGFIDAISKYPGIHFLKKLNNYTITDPTENAVEQFLKENTGVNLIYAQNDYMAYDAYKLCKKLGINNKVKIIGIDGLPVKDAGLDMVANKYIAATVLYPTGGQEAIQTAINILEGKPYKKENRLLTTIIDSNNVRIMKMQHDKVLAQQKDIDLRQAKIEQQEIISKNQTNIIYTISITLAMALIFGGISFYYLKENRQINKRLAQQNEEISKQRNQLIELSKQAQQANEARINFFTNISHEFRTPLTLMVGPLDDLLRNEKITKLGGNSLLLIQRNAFRLLRLINQLIDFRKVEIDKLKLNVAENDIIFFVKQIVEAYNDVAGKRNIDLRLITKETVLNVWFDETMLDKVLFNLLSNAFKFTGDDGHIYVKIKKDEAAKTVSITVEDNGIGMTATDVDHAFDLFYQGSDEQYKGSGIGLALSKQLMLLHHGSICAESEKGKGAKFTITLPLENTHLQEDRLQHNEDIRNVLHEDVKIYTTELKQPQSRPIILQENSAKENAVLIIEDNKDLREYLSNFYSQLYEIIEAADGNAGLQKAFETIPDIIISDVMMPGKNGFELTNALKNDLRTSHIPIILLTAKNSVEAQIEGMKYNADAYISKPFNQQHLEATIKSLLHNRLILKEYYSGNISQSQDVKHINKLDRRFINDLNALIEENLSNEHFSVDDICKSVGISRVQLYRKIKALLNTNATDYITEKRVQKAKYLLRHESLTIAEIAYKTGFSSPAYFSTVFKQKFSVTPSEYKDRKVK